jgi:flagellar biosynthetic protein FliQ
VREGAAMMEVPQALDLGREALLITLVIAAPVLGTGVLVGIVISLLQIVTQVQDQTVSIVPKIVAMFAAAVLFTPWLVRHLVEYTQAVFAGG